MPIKSNSLFFVCDFDGFDDQTSQPSMFIDEYCHNFGFLKLLQVPQ